MADQEDLTREERIGRRLDELELDMRIRLAGLEKAVRLQGNRVTAVDEAFGALADRVEALEGVEPDGGAPTDKDDLLAEAWVVIASAHGWDDPKLREWREAAARWRDKYHSTDIEGEEPKRAGEDNLGLTASGHEVWESPGGCYRLRLAPGLRVDGWHRIMALPKHGSLGRVL